MKSVTTVTPGSYQWTWNGEMMPVTPDEEDYVMPLRQTEEPFPKRRRLVRPDSDEELVGKSSHDRV